MTAPYTQSQTSGGYNPYGQTFSNMQTAGVARPPSGVEPVQPYQNMAYSTQPQMDPYGTQPSGATVPPQSYSPTLNSPYQGSQGTFSPSAMPDLSGMWNQLWGASNVGYGAPQAGHSNYSPGSYQGPGTFGGYQGSSYDPGAYRNGASPMSGPGGAMQFQNGGFGGMTDAATFGSIMSGLQNPSRYGAGEALQAYKLLNDQLTQGGNADYARINEDMARRGIYDSTTAGGRLGDLATNLNNQRQAFASNIAQDQARTYASDRAQAIQQAMGYGGQQFGQRLGGFNANLAAQGQNFGQGLQAGQFNEGLSQNAYQNNLGRNEFLLGQNNQNYNQQANQYGLNTQNAENKYQAGLSNAQFGLNQNQQNYANQANQFNQQQGANQQTFQQMLAALTGQQANQQQSFNNQVTTQQTNQQQQQAYMNYLLQMMGYTQ